jgi:hypothetical protein
MKAIADPSTRENKTKHIVAGWAVIDVMTWKIPTRKTWVLVDFDDAFSPMKEPKSFVKSDRP